MRRLTLIDWMVITAIVGMLLAVFLIEPEKNRPTYQCISGYKFTFNGNQIFNEHGRGIKCEEANNE